MIFVFGSNEGGIHGAGAAAMARAQYGAIMGRGFGHMGNCFAIPTKNVDISRTLPLEVIHSYVKAFLNYAKGRPDLQFKVTRIGCGLAGLKDEDVAKLFYGAPSNCLFDSKWDGLIPGDARYYFWGTF